MPPKKRGSRATTHTAVGRPRIVLPPQSKPSTSRASSHLRRVPSSDDDISAGVPFYDQLPSEMLEGSSQPFPTVGDPLQVSVVLLQVEKCN